MSLDLNDFEFAEGKSTSNLKSAVRLDLSGTLFKFKDSGDKILELVGSQMDELNLS